MAKYIDREALRDALYDADAITMQGVKLLNQFPAVDAVPVVRCKDCIHSYEEFGFIYCTCELSVDGIVPPDFYCPFGETPR